jgi:hypothetical protein
MRGGIDHLMERLVSVVNTHELPRIVMQRRITPVTMLAVDDSILTRTQYEMLPVVDPDDVLPFGQLSVAHDERIYVIGVLREDYYERQYLSGTLVRSSCGRDTQFDDYLALWQRLPLYQLMESRPALADPLPAVAEYIRRVTTPIPNYTLPRNRKEQDHVG